MSDIEHARAMLQMVESDLKALQGILHPSLFGYAFFSDAIFGFHAQQAAEKCLKAWIASKGMSFPRTHDLMALIEILSDAGVTDELDDLVDLNAFASNIDIKCTSMKIQLIAIRFSRERF